MPDASYDCHAAGGHPASSVSLVISVFQMYILAHDACQEEICLGVLAASHDKAAGEIEASAARRS
jgi:hypothetical protein